MKLLPFNYGCTGVLPSRFWRSRFISPQQPLSNAVSIYLGSKKSCHKPFEPRPVLFAVFQFLLADLFLHHVPHGPALSSLRVSHASRQVGLPSPCFLPLPSFLHYVMEVHMLTRPVSLLSFHFSLTNLVQSYMRTRRFNGTSASPVRKLPLL